MKKRFIIKAIILGLLCVGVGVLLPLFIPGLAEKYGFWQKTYRLRRAIAADPSDIKNYNRLLLEYYSHGPDYVEEIIAIEEKLLELGPNKPHAGFSLAHALARYEPESQAEREERNKRICDLVDMAISLSGDEDILLYAQAGYLLSEIGEIDRAREYLQYALSHFKGDTVTVEIIHTQYRKQLDESIKNLGKEKRILDSLKQLLDQ